MSRMPTPPLPKSLPGGSADFQHRDIDFALDEDIPAHWIRDDCHVTRFYDAMSIMFPEGERTFIESVLHFRDQVRAPVLRAAVKEFTTQEAMHTREHLRDHRRLARQGVPVARLERQVAKQQIFARRYFSAAFRLAATACLEHFTAMFADGFLRDPRNLDGAYPTMVRFWRWHALEEIEHKAVAFDVLTVAVPRPAWRYLLRCSAMLLVTAVFSTLLWRMTFALIRHDGRALDVRGWAHLLWVQCGKPGVFRRMLPQWVAWFSPRFHPWRHDNRDLIAAYAREFEGSKHSSSGEDRQ